MTKVTFTLIETNHIIIDCKINGVNGKFILDTGASSSCIDLLSADKFSLSFEKFKEKTSSATNIIKETFQSKKNTFEIAGLIKTNFELILFDMKQINDSLNEKIDKFLLIITLSQNNLELLIWSNFCWQ